MRIHRTWLAAALMLGGMVLATPAPAQLLVQPGISGKQATFSTTGNLVLDGHCFANTSIPTGPRVSTFNGTSAFLNGSLYLAGSLNELSSSIPGGLTFRNGATGSAVSSITSAGNLYLAGTCSNSSGCSNTKYEPSRWNDGGRVQYCNNCYNYGNDTRTDNYAQPGEAAGQKASYPYTTDNVRVAAVADGLTWLGASFPGNNYDCGKGHLIFMAVRPSGGDYHWWRLDHAAGLWSHKPGPDPARNVDYSNNPITNPLTSDRGSYGTPGGFFCNCGSKATIKGSSSCNYSAAFRPLAAAPGFDSQAGYSVELDVFAGRPNPSFELTPAEVNGLTSLLGRICSNAPMASAARYPEGFLGYRGITVFRSVPGTQRNPSLQMAGGAVRVHGGNVPDACRVAVRSGTDLSLLDPGQAAEKYLIEIAHARGVIDDIVYQDIVTDMQGKR